MNDTSPLKNETAVPASDTSPLAHVRIVLSHTSHPGNIGAAARAMKTMGLSRLVLVNPKHFPDPQADAMAAGAVDILEQARVCASVEDALVGTTFATAMTARRRGLAVEPLWAREAAAELAVLAVREEVALVFGNETAGLSNEEVSLCQRWAKIPTDPEWSSLNLAQAVQVLCYEMRMAAVAVGAPPPVNDAGEPASHEEIEGLMAHLERAVIASEFLDPEKPKRLMPRMRRMFARAGLEKEEVNILRGMLTSFEKGPYRK
ncbi:MAG: RNA methyltransferase [Rhodocyclales bacterium]|nr:RNA methyltransferase [Rhodocyclales bacterium]